MNRFRIILVLAALSVQTLWLQAQTFSWNGAISRDWNTSTNWTPNGIPGPGSTVNINSDAVPNICRLDANRSIAILSVTAGTLDLNGFALTTTTRSSFSGGVVSGGGISAPTIPTLRDTEFQGAMTITKTGGTNNYWAGRNTFNGPVTIVNQGTAFIRMANTNGDIFNDDVHVINNTLTSRIDVAQRDTTYFNGNVTLDNTSTQGIRIGAGNDTTTRSYMAPGFALLTNGFSNGQLLIRRMDQAGTVANGTFTPSTATFSFCDFGGNIAVTTTATTLTIDNCTFSANNTFASETNMAINGVNNFSTVSGITTLTINGSTGTMAWEGGNTFGDVIITNNAPNLVRMALTNGDTFARTATFVNTGVGGLQVAYRGTNSFADDITLANSGSGGIAFGTSTGTSVQTTGRLVNDGYSNGLLTINGFTQTSSAANDAFAPTIFTSTASTFNGNFSLNTTGTTITLSSCNFNGTSNSFTSNTSTTITSSNFPRSNTITPGTSLTLTNANTFSTTSGSTSLTHNSATGTVTWTGGNTFGNVTITKNAAQILRLSNTTGDTYSGTASFVNTAANALEISYLGSSSFAGNITLTNSSTAGISFGASTGTSVQTSGRLINGGYTLGPLTLNRFTQSGTTANDAFSPTVFSALNSTINGNFSISTTNGAITLNGSTFRATNIFLPATTLTLTNANAFSTTSGSTSLTHNSAAGTVTWTGGNTFGNVTITKNAAQILRLSGTSGDTYLGTASFVNTAANALEISYAGSSSFAGNITLTNSSAAGISFGISTGTTLQSSGRLINGGYTLGPLTLNRFTQTGTIANDAFSPTVFSSLNSTINGSFSISTTTGTITLNGSNFTASNTFLPATTLTLTNANSFSTVSGTTQLTNSASGGIISWTGGNTFGPVTITNNAVGALRLANSVRDIFTSTSAFNNTAAGGIQISYAGGVSTFADDINLNNSGIGGISLGASTGSTSLTSGSMLSSGFSNGPLTLNRVTQSSTEANGAFTPTLFTALNTTLNGNFTLTTTTSTITITTSSFTASNVFSAATTITLNNANTFSTVSGSTAFTIGGGGNITWTGGNTFGNVVVTTNSANYLRMANTNGDVFTGSATFVQNAAGILSPAYNGTSTFSGNISTVGTAIAITFGSGTGVVVLNGTSTQTLSGSALRIPVIQRLTMNTTGSGNLTVAVPLNIGVSLTLTSGLINTDDTNLLTLTDETVTTTTGNANAYVNGPMQYVHNSNSATRSVLNLPLGKGGEWRPGVLSVGHSTTTSYTYRAEVFAASADALGLAVPFNVVDVSNTRYWNIGRFLTSTMISSPAADLRTAGGQEPIVQLFFGLSDGITDGSFLTICKNTDADPGSWIDIGSSATPPYDGGANLTGSITSTSLPTAFNSFSLFTLGNLNNALPVTWVSFEASAVQQKVQLDWQTATEINTDQFVIERSANGKDFVAIAYVPAAGNSTSLLSYQMADKQPLPGVSYYRLRQLDLDGNFDFSPTRSVNRTGIGSDEWAGSAFPNPFTDYIYVNTNILDSGTTELRLYDWTGALKAQVTSHDDNLTLKTADLVPGIYLLEVENSGQVQRYKIVKQ